MGLPEKFRNRSVLFRGLPTSNHIPFMLANGLTFGTVARQNEFGSGVYTTPNLDYAMAYCASANGVLMIFDWSDHGGDVSIKEFTGMEWEQTVKGYLCLGGSSNKPGPPQHDADIFEGPVSQNNEHIPGCARPVPTSITQVVSKTERGRNAFAARLICIMYFQI
jgi:hypothetical protein